MHLWREADFTLLFHASIENNPVAVQLLLEKGADPRRANNRGTNVLMLMMKRSQIEMAELCMSKVPNGILLTNLVTCLKNKVYSSIPYLLLLLLTCTE